MNDPKPKLLTIKVTDGDTVAYFIHFDRITHDLISVYEHRQIYTPGMGEMSKRNRIIVDLAKSRIGQALETAGVKL